MGSTMHDVARAAGVSIKTVSNVINDYPHVRPSTRGRVLDAIQELNYRPNVSARGLRSGKTGIIGLAVPALRENYFAELADTIIRVAARRGLGVVVEQTSGDREAELMALSGGRLRFVDGLLFSPLGLGQEDVGLLDVPLPLVLLGERIFNGPTDHVAMHNTSPSQAAVEYLIARGRSRIAIVGADLASKDEISSAGLRLRGYLKALDQAGIDLDPALVRGSAGWNRLGGAEVTRELIADGVDFDAVFALNDTLALGAMRALGESGRDVPSDVAVMGFDNIDEAAFSLPSLTSIDIDKQSIAETAIDLLVERINEKGERRPPRTVKPDFRIVGRESTGDSPDDADEGARASSS